VFITGITNTISNAEKIYSTINKFAPRRAHFREREEFVEFAPKRAHFREREEFLEIAPEERVSEEGRNFWRSFLKSASPRKGGIFGDRPWRARLRGREEFLEIAPEERVSEEGRNEGRILNSF